MKGGAIAMHIRLATYSACDGRSCT